MIAHGSPLILIVDDFQDALEIYQVALTVSGYRVLTATGGADAVALTLAHRPALVLMDLRMPTVTGTDALNAIRADPACAHIPVVALTAHAMLEERQEALRRGFTDVIAKPCLPDDLVSAVGRLLDDTTQQP
jgi:CheY-like chemotaxis protein